MEQENYKFVDFDVYCPACKHYPIKDKPRFNPNVGVYDGEKWSGAYTKEEVEPCCTCLEEGAREGTTVPLCWESKK